MTIQEYAESTSEINTHQFDSLVAINGYLTTGLIGNMIEVNSAIKRCAKIYAEVLASKKKDTAQKRDGEWQRARAALKQKLGNVCWYTVRLMIENKLSIDTAYFPESQTRLGDLFSAIILKFPANICNAIETKQGQLKSENKKSAHSLLHITLVYLVSVCDYFNMDFEEVLSISLDSKIKAFMDA